MNSLNPSRSEFFSAQVPDIQGSSGFERVHVIAVSGFPILQISIPTLHIANPASSSPHHLGLPEPVAPHLAAQPEQALVPETWEFRPKPKQALGPLDRFPSSAWFAPGLSFLLLASIATFFGGRGDLSVSGEGVFRSGELWNLVTALFAHGSLEHFLSNALPLVVFSWLLSGYFGLFFFPIVPLFVGVASNLVTVSIYDPAIRLLGASGMVYGMVALWIVLFFKFSKESRWGVKFLRAAGFAVLLLFPTQYEPNVSYLAHASGFAVGLGTGFIVLPYAKGPRASSLSA